MALSTSNSLFPSLHDRQLANDLGKFTYYILLLYKYSIYIPYFSLNVRYIFAELFSEAQRQGVKTPKPGLDCAGGFISSF